MLTMIVVPLQVLNHETDGFLGLVNQELLQHGLWAQGRHSGYYHLQGPDCMDTSYRPALSLHPSKHAFRGWYLLRTRTTEA
jgi:hypothetical protein